MVKKAVCIMSGGMDSTLCAVLAKRAGYEIIALHFDYGQRTMKREKIAFEQICERIGALKKINLDASFIASIGGNALTDESLAIRKDGAKPDTPSTYVPFRNGIFISVAAALAEKEGAQVLYIGIVEEDGSGYPDCTADFIAKIESAVNAGTSKDFSLQIVTPLVNLSKADIVRKSLEAGSPLELTWSCYEREDEACGECDSCRLRLRGFELAGEKDRIKYVNLK